MFAPYLTTDAARLLCGDVAVLFTIKKGYRYRDSPVAEGTEIRNLLI